MTNEEQDLLMIRGFIAGLPDEDRSGVSLAAAKLRDVVALHNDHGHLALALVGAELAAKD